MTVSERIFKIMEEKGISQIDFSRGTGIAQSVISDWKRKKTNPGSDKIMLICDVLGVSPYEVLQDTSIRRKKRDNDYIIVNSGTEYYEFLVEIESLDERKKERLRGYLSALREE